MIYAILVLIEFACIILNLWYPIWVLGNPFYFLIVACINLFIAKKSYVAALISQFLLIVLNDILCRYYPGGKIDGEGAEWITMMSLLSFLFSFIVMFIFLLVNRAGSTRKKLRDLFYSIIASAVYLVISLNWGVNVTYPK